MTSEATKQWGHRTVSPDVTLERLRPHYSTMGITRVADITGLDRLGVPVFQAIRPMGRSLSVSQGKGVTMLAAEVSAAMEACETWHAEVWNPEQITASIDAIPLEDRIDIDGFLPSDEPRADTDMAWVQAMDYKTGAEVMVPFDLVSMDFTRLPALPELKRSSNGLAGGNTAEEALSSALHELIERDCQADFLALAPQERRRRRLDPKDMAARHEDTAWLLDRVAENQLHIDLFDMTNDLAVPAILVRLYEVGAAPKARPCFGAGCHLDLDWAVIRAITEAIQSRLTRIAGSRDDILPETYILSQTGNMGSRLSASGSYLSANDNAQRSCRSTDSPLWDVRQLCNRLEAVGCGQVAVVDLTRGDIGIPVVKAIVPGLGYMQKSGFRPGERHKVG